MRHHRVRPARSAMWLFCLALGALCLATNADVLPDEPGWSPGEDDNDTVSDGGGALLTEQHGLAAVRPLSALMVAALVSAVAAVVLFALGFLPAARAGQRAELLG